MNALEVGGLIILYLFLSQGISGYIVNQSDPEFNVGDCFTVTEEGNHTVCNGGTGPSFIESAGGVAVEGIPGAGNTFNSIWVSINAFLLTLALILIVAYFVGLLFGGAS